MTIKIYDDNFPQKSNMAEESRIVAPTKVSMDSGGSVNLENTIGHLEPGNAGFDDTDVGMDPQPCLDCTRIFLEQSRQLEVDLVEDRR